MRRKKELTSKLLAFLLAGVLCFVMNTTEIRADEPARGICITPRVGETVRLSASPNPADIGSAAYVWSSDNPEVALVDQTGVVTALTVGVARIYAQKQNGSWKGSMTIKVIANLDENPLTIVLSVGQAMQLDADYLLDGEGETAWWFSSDTSVVTVSGSGLALAQAEGAALLTVQNDTGTKTAQLYVIVMQED